MNSEFTPEVKVLGMVDSLEESSATNGAEVAPEIDLSNLPEDNANAGSLEVALNNSEPYMSGTLHPFRGSAREPGSEPEGRRGAAMMPQGSLLNIPVNVQVILGSTRMSLHKVMSLGPGSIVALDKELSEPVTLLVNGNEVARGLIVVVNEKTGQLGISLTDVSSNGSSKTSSSRTV
ncbi:MAG: FliM/FliN family flagellar motor switch protein [Aestuariivirga sp.]